MWFGSPKPRRTRIISPACSSSFKERFTVKEINHGNLVILAKFYGVSTDYLLCMTENRNHTNTALTELHLSDEMVDLLRSGVSITGFFVR